jgi:hypothetical protein
MGLRKWPSVWLCGVLMLTLFPVMADAAVPPEAAVPGFSETVDAVPRTVVVLSEVVNITLAQGTFDSVLQPFPAMDTGDATIRANMPMQLTGQLVDGNYTLLSYGGGMGAALKNKGVAGHGEQIRWWFAGQEQAPLQVCWRSPDDPDDGKINGTFFIRNWLPDPALVPAAGPYEMRFNFSGTRVHYPGMGEFQVYPPTQLRFWANVVFPTRISVLEPGERVDGGTIVAIRGNVMGADGARVSGGMVVSADGSTLGPPMPGGIYLDEVAVSVPGIPTTVFREGFESPSVAWAHGGDFDDWETGTPVELPRAYMGLRCIGTGIDGPYSHMADEWTQTPSIDLSRFQADAQLSFAFWSELRTGDFAELWVWNGSDWSDPLSISTGTGDWSVRTVELGTLTCRGRHFPVAGTDDVRIRFRLKSMTPSAPVVQGAFDLDWAIPRDGPPGPVFLEFKFVPNGPYATSFANLKVDVASPMQIIVPADWPRLGPDRWAELKARLLDGRGQPPQIPIGRAEGSPLRVFWDDGAGHLSEVESVTAPNFTGWFAAARQIPAGQSLEMAAFIIRFEGTDRYQPAQTRVNCTVRGQPRLELDNVPPAVRNGTARVEGTLMLGERPVAFGELSLTLPFAPFRLNLTTDASGRFSAHMNVPGGWPQDTFSIYGLAIPGKGMLPASASINIPVIRVLSMKFEGRVLEKGSAVETTIDTMRFNGFAGRVTDENGRPAAGIEVVVEALRPGGNELLGRTSTGPTGYFSLPHSVDWSERTGRLVVSATAFSPPSPPAIREAGFTVTAGTILSLDEPPILWPGGYANLSGTLLEDRALAPGEPVKDALVGIDFGGKSYDAITDITGRFRVRCAVTQSQGNVSIRASFSGNDAVRPSSVLTNAAVAMTEPEAKIKLPEGKRQAPSATAVAAGSVLLAALGAALIGGTEAARVKLLLALAPLYSKIRKEEVLDQFVRGQVFGYVQANPGDHYSSIRQTLHLKNGTLAYHLRTLERESFIFSRMDGIFRRFYPSGADPARIRMRGNLKETHRKMLELVEASPGITPKELAIKLGTSHQVASYHIRLLSRRGRIRLETKGRNTLCFPAAAQLLKRGV